MSFARAIENYRDEMVSRFPDKHAAINAARTITKIRMICFGQKYKIHAEQTADRLRRANMDAPPPNTYRRNK